MAREDFDEERRGKATDLTAKEADAMDVSTLLTTEEASQYLADLPKPFILSVGSLLVYRSKGSGPEYLIDWESGAVRYEPEALLYYAARVCKKMNSPFNALEAKRIAPPKGHPMKRDIDEQ